MIAFRPMARGALAATAVLCFLFTGASIFCTLAAGTLQMDGDYPDGPANLFLSSLSVVRFKGMVAHPNGDGTSYEVTLHWFLNAFGWEWPSTTWDRSTGIVNNINGIAPGSALTLPRDLVEAARRLKLPEEEYWCLYDGDYYSRGGVCHNPYFAAWHDDNPPRTSFGTAIPLLVLYFAGIMVLTTAIAELCVRYGPRSLASCYCPGFIRDRRWCPCLKEDEEMTPSVRNRFRVSNLCVLVVTYAVSFLLLLLKGIQLRDYLNKVDSQVGGMEVQLGEGFLWMNSVTVVAACLSLGCLWLRERIAPTQSWMEEQGIAGAKDDVDLDRTEDRPANEGEVSL